MVSSNSCIGKNVSTLQYITLNVYFSKDRYCICLCAQKWSLAVEAIDFLTASVYHLPFPAGTACNMRPQVFLYPQQSILLSRTPWPGWGLPKYLSPPTHSPAYPHPGQKAFSVIKNISDSRPGQSNNGQTSQRDYRALTVSLLGRRYAWSECSRKAKKSKKSL